MERIQIPSKLPNPKAGLNFLSQAQQHRKRIQIQAKHLQLNKDSIVPSHSKGVNF